jgi:hypothetical protein
MLARWLMEQRERPSAANANDSSSSGSQAGAHSVSDNFLTDQALPPPAPNGVFETSAISLVRLHEVSLSLLVKGPDTRSRPGVSGCSSLSGPQETAHAPVPDARVKQCRTPGPATKLRVRHNALAGFDRAERPLNPLAAVNSPRTSLPPPTYVMAALYGL